MPVSPGSPDSHTASIARRFSTPSLIILLEERRSRACLLIATEDPGLGLIFIDLIPLRNKLSRDVSCMTHEQCSNATAREIPRPNSSSKTQLMSPAKRGHHIDARAGPRLSRKNGIPSCPERNENASRDGIFCRERTSWIRALVITV
jgi:hypothetical protein